MHLKVLSIIFFFIPDSYKFDIFDVHVLLIIDAINSTIKNIFYAMLVFGIMETNIHVLVQL